MPLISDKDTLLIRCNCHGHVLEISNDDYGIEDGCIPDFDISVWNQTPTPMNLWQRIRLIWYLVRGKTIDGGDVIIDQEDATSIIQFLSKKLIENQNKLSNYRKKHESAKKM